MRIHSDTLNAVDLFEAARISRVDLTYTGHGSRTRERSWDVSLTGESRRRPNFGRPGYAATWDQWGVFLAVLFDRDPNMLCGSSEKYAAYRDRADFHWQTADRFRPSGITGPSTPGAIAVTGDPDYDGTWDGPVYRHEGTYWPSDAHGDHRFTFAGTMGEQKCTKCSAIKRWR